MGRSENKEKDRKGWSHQNFRTWLQPQAKTSTEQLGTVQLRSAQHDTVVL